MKRSRKYVGALLMNSSICLMGESTKRRLNNEEFEQSLECSFHRDELAEPSRYRPPLAPLALEAAGKFAGTFASPLRWVNFTRRSIPRCGSVLHADLQIPTSSRTSAPSSQWVTSANRMPAFCETSPTESGPKTAATTLNPPLGTISVPYTAANPETASTTIT